MSRHILYITVLLLQSGPLFAQLPDNIPSVDKTDMPEASFAPARIFNGTALYGFINGGADLYLEYGFSVAVVTEIDYRGGNYKTAIYKMIDEEAAFGIFSVSKFKCTQMPPLSDFTCQTRYHLQMCKGPYYVSIINASGSEADMAASLEIGKIIAGKILEPDMDLSVFLPGIPKEEILKNCFLAKGRLGIVNGSPDLEDIFKGVSGYTAVILQNDNKTAMSVEFASEEIYHKFVEFINHDPENLAGTGFRFRPDSDIRKISENHLYITMSRKD